MYSSIREHYAGLNVADNCFIYIDCVILENVHVLDFKGLAWMCVFISSYHLIRSLVLLLLLIAHFVVVCFPPSLNCMRELIEIRNSYEMPMFKIAMHHLNCVALVCRCFGKFVFIANRNVCLVYSHSVVNIFFE